MKITIELEIEPDEVPLATELISTLRLLTDHVKVETLGAAAVSSARPAASVTSAATAAPSMPALQQPASVTSLPNGAVPQPPAPIQATVHAPTQPQAPPPAPAQVQAAAAPAPAQPAAAAAAAPARPHPAPPAPQPASAGSAPPRPPQQPYQSQLQTFQALVPRLGNPATQEQAVVDIIAVLRSVDESNVDKVFEELVAAYEQCVFQNPEVIPNGVMPYVMLYTRVPDDLRVKMREKLVSKVISTLNRKRPVNVDRSTFFGYADAFACLVKFEAVPMDGAIQTLSRLLMKTDSRCQAVTMLGKTVEYCGDQVVRVPESSLALLWRALGTVTEDTFQYDMHYILNTLHATMAAQSAAGAPAGAHVMAAIPPGQLPAGAARSAAAAAAAPTAAGLPAQTTPTGLTQIGTYNGHTATVFSMYYDAVHGQLFSAAQDGQLICWGPEGIPVGRMDISSHYVCSVSVLPRSGTVVAAAVPNVEEGRPVEGSCLLGFSPPPTLPRVGAWSPRGKLQAPNRGIISFAVPLGDGDVFVMGEDTAASDPSAPVRDIVYVYDATRGTPLDRLTPLRAYAEHTEMVTTAAAWNQNPNVFATAGRDHTVLVWDRRVEGSVGMFGELNPMKGRAEAHSDMVSALDTTENFLLSSCVDSFMCIWDFRQLSMTHGSAVGPVVRMQIDETPILKMAVTGAPHSRLAALSTYRGLHVMDFTNMTAPLTVSIQPPLDSKYQFHDLRWAGGQPVFFAASEASEIVVAGVTF
ncbi:hypothetical protein Vafri_18968 [Volvox africanus]|uniref:Guanine nucleotide-binding protein subunit beta-like protein n=1 Tax=Volvox africanus TaxID=51714 RepID=A0A8J4BTM8_9CHLO|nr:hypothetical protein Vafri_18968 [Volvox africanus]